MKSIVSKLQTSVITLSLLASLGSQAATILDGPTHVDIGVGWISTNSGSARWDLHVHNETDDIEFAPDEAILLVNNSAFFSSPGGVFAPILGPSGTPNWRLPQSFNPSLLYLGLGAEGIETNLFVGDMFSLSLSAVSGPGHFAMYQVDGFGVPTAFFNTRDGISGADTVSLSAGGHGHYNFAFSEPGTYTVTLQASGTLIAGSEFTQSDLADYTFVVVPEPSTYALLAGGGVALTAWNLRRRRAQK
jgi:surface-anchored protein